MLEFKTGSDGMAYLIASRIKGERKAFNVEEIAEKDEEMEKKERKQYMDINEAHQKFGHATERVVRETLKALEIIATGKCPFATDVHERRRPKRTNKTTKVTADKPGERLYMDTSGPYSKQSWGHATGSSLWMTKRKSWDFYGARKNVITKFLKDLLDKLKAAGKPVKYLRLTLTQVFDPELILEEEAPIEHEEEVASEEIHLIPEYEEELAVVQRSLSPPLSEAGRIHADTTFNDDERPRIDGEIDERSDDDRDDQVRKTDDAAAIEDESDSDDSRSVQTDDSDERVEEEDLPELPQRENAPEMAENETNDKVDEIDQTERPQRSVTRLENEMKRLGIDEPIRIEDDEVGVRTRSRTDQVAFNATLSSDPGEPKTFRKAMDGKNGVKWKPSAIVKSTIFCHVMPGRSFPERC
ncbi:hypothetical protein MHU86_5541 [Fragilaria crotonensis]|nr:hypothetical protein MHU86_5541 [Fragilaria crotonensis]